MAERKTRGKKPKLSPELLTWLNAGMAKHGKTNAGLARAIGIPAQQITHLRRGDRKISADEVPVIADYIEEPTPPSCYRGTTPLANTGSSAIPSTPPKMRQAVFPISDGNVTMNYPAKLSATGRREFERYIRILLQNAAQK
jgi:hypothetical protein